MPLNESELPTKVAYHPNVRCVRGGGGEGPVIVGRMYRVGEEYVCEDKATPEEKAKDPVEPAKNFRGDQVEGFDLRGWAAADIQGLPRDADGKLDLMGAILCGVNLVEADLNKAIKCVTFVRFNRYQIVSLYDPLSFYWRIERI